MYKIRLKYKWITQQKINKLLLAEGGKQTLLNPEERKTGQGTTQEASSGAESETPGAKNADIAGDPNQGTEAR